MQGTQALVPGRECGACHACCTVFDIDDAPVHKPAGITCSNYNGHGCAIYTKRPGVCRAFHCQWRYETMLDENWRPDRSGVVITTESIESGLRSGQAVGMLVFGDHAVVFDDGFAIFAATCIDRGHEVLLRVRRASGNRVPEARLSVFVGEAVSAGNLFGVKTGIREAYQALMAMNILPQEPAG
jgi:hypothetical protein